MKQKALYFDSWIKEKLKSPVFRKAYEEDRLALRLGYKICQLRQRLGLTQADLAHRMRTKKQAIVRLERGDYKVFSLQTLMRIAATTKTELVIDLRKRPKKSSV